MGQSNKPDRYVSFEGIDCAENSKNVIKFTLELIQQDQYKNKFWDLFLEKVEKAKTSETEEDDILYIVCSNVYYLEELFEAAGHTEGIEALGLCEYDCC